MPIRARRFCLALATLAFAMATVSHAQVEDDSADFFGDAPAKVDASKSGEDFFGDGATPSVFTKKGEFGGEIWQKLATDTVKDRGGEYLHSSLSLLLAEGNFNVTPKLSARLSGLVTYEFDWNATHHFGEYDAQVWEAYGDYRLGDLDLCVGQRVWAWGQTDIVSPTNLINPVDFRRFLDAEMNLARMPVPSLAATWYFGDLRLTGIALPFARGAQFDVVRSGHSLFGHEFPLGELLRFAKDDRGYRGLKRFLDLWIPDWQDDLQDAFDDPDFYADRIEHPQDDFTHASGAARFGGRVRGWDFDVMGYYLYDQIPTIYLNPQLHDLLRAGSDAQGNYAPIPDPRDLSTTVVTDPFRATWSRIGGTGADIGTTFGPVALRAEGTAIWGRRTYRNDFTSVEKPVYNYAANLEYTLPGDIMVSAVWYQSHLADYERDLIAEPVNSVLFLAWRATFLQDRLKTEGVAAYDFSELSDDEWRDGDVFGEGAQLSPFIEWAWTDTVRTAVGANLLTGNRYTLFGFFRERSRVFTTLKLDF
ncbi:MAG: hypothetical protein KJ042_06690 [Deltaproteobacteria bacterium]|nr:hypothetical protein [Deltaproteobacteria bacterium]